MSLISDICGCGKSHSRILVVLTSCGKKKQYVLQSWISKEGASGSREDFPGAASGTGIGGQGRTDPLVPWNVRYLAGRKNCTVWRRGRNWQDVRLSGSLRTIAEVFYVDRKRKSVGTASGGGVHFQHCIAESHSNRIYSIFIQGAVGTRHDPVSSSGSGAERKGTLCLWQQAGTTNRGNPP